MAVFFMQVDVHTLRPFKDSPVRTLWSIVDVPDSGDDTKDLLQARMTAAYMAECHPAVAQVAAVTLLYAEV